MNQDRVIRGASVQNQITLGRVLILTDALCSVPMRGLSLEIWVLALFLPSCLCLRLDNLPSDTQAFQDGSPHSPPPFIRGSQSLLPGSLSSTCSPANHCTSYALLGPSYMSAVLLLLRLSDTLLYPP